MRPSNMSGEDLGRDQSCTTRGRTFDKNDIEDGLWQLFLGSTT